MCLRFACLLITQAAAWLRLSRRQETPKTAEILILCHQLASCSDVSSAARGSAERTGPCSRPWSA